MWTARWRACCWTRTSRAGAGLRAWWWRARGEGGYRRPSGDGGTASGGGIKSTLTGVYPWGRYALGERVSLWGVAGYGSGTLTLTPEDQTPIGSGGNLASSEADVTRLRLGLEGKWRGLGTLVPTLEVGARHDGGDAETGFGADIGGRLAWSDPALGMRAELAARGLLTHADGSLREWGLAGSLSWDPDPGSERGPELTLRHAAGAEASGGMDALLRPETARVLEVRDAGLVFGLDVEGARNERLDRDAEPEHRIALGFGWRLLRARREVLELRIEAARRRTADDRPENRLGIRLSARW